jgi:hypothetical protein
LSFVQLAGGGAHSAALLSDGSILAWGLNDRGQCTPPVLPPGVSFVSVSAGWHYTVALCSDGSAVAFGDNAFGQCNVPTLSPGVSFVDIQSRGEHTVARLSDGSSLAWGRNSEEQCNIPALAPGEKFAQLAAGWQHSIGLTEPLCPAPLSYCTAKLNSLGCMPTIGSSGTPSATAASGFAVNATNMINNKSCLMFYGTTGQSSGAFQGGILCVKAPVKRTPGTTTGGNPPPNDCSGAPSIDMTAFAVGALGGTPLSALTVPGTVVTCQWWGRDPGFAAPINTQLTNGLQYTICP